jgi:hypothetical protein
MRCGGALPPRGTISDDEYVGMTFPQYYKTVEEFTRPLTDAASPLSRAGLRLEQCETRVVPRPLAAEFHHHRDAHRFARDYIPTVAVVDPEHFSFRALPKSNP